MSIVTTSQTLSQRDKKRITALKQRKERLAERLFVAEGSKLIEELLVAFPCRLLVTTASEYVRVEHLGWIERVVLLPDSYDFGSISSQRSPRPMIALLELPPSCSSYCLDAPTLLLDNVQDPGNVGSIIRSADWFGIRHILTTEGTADPFSPKVVQATMGALARVRVTPIGDLSSLFAEVKQRQIPLLGTFLDGENIFKMKPFSRAIPYIIVMGNEGQGISPCIAEQVTHRLTIPSSAPDGMQVESLNVAAATAIVLSYLRREE